MCTRYQWICLAFCGAWLAQASQLWAADPAPEGLQGSQQAAVLLEAALEAEAEGDLLTRQRLLTEAEQASADFPRAHWLRGQMRAKDGQWLDVAASVRAAADDKRLEEYERKRSNLPDNLASHWSMAGWCMEQGLEDQARSHLHRVLQFEPDHTAARTALGFRLVGSEWISPQQIARLVERTQVARQSLKTFRRPLKLIVAKLASAESSDQQAGVEALNQIQDALAVPAVEAALASPAAPVSHVALQWFANIDNQEASQVLARYSLFHPVVAVREDATEKLRQRPLHDYVPELLAMLSSPVSTMLVPAFDEDGLLTGYRQAFGQEKFDKLDYVVLDRVFLKAPTQTARTLFQERENRVRDQVTDRVLREVATLETLGRQLEVVLENAQQKQRNARVLDVLGSIAEREFADDPKEAWDWWDDTNETGYQQFKPERYRRRVQADQVVVYDETPPVGRASGECFVAGTQVMTHRGLRPIERIAIGDLVLSRSVYAGELLWKPVLRCTIRPPEAILEIAAGKDQLQCTRGHLFWVSGEGWRKASELQPGDILHGAAEPTVVASISPRPALPTFNLEVADTANYFVGKSQVLTHDVTPRTSLRQRVPGQLIAASNE